jgi:hypothetical protein
MNGVDDAKKIREHNRLSSHLEAVTEATSHVTGGDAAPRMWTCDTCNEQISADPAVVNAHNASHEHARMARMAHTEQHRVDGQVLAAEQREKNGAAKNARKKRS